VGRTKPKTSEKVENKNGNHSKGALLKGKICFDEF